MSAFADGEQALVLLHRVAIGHAGNVVADGAVGVLIGAGVAWLYERYNKSGAEMYTIPVSSGIIAGESLMGILIAMLIVTGILAA